MKFDLTQENSSIIKVIGVGGGGSNAVNHMYKQGIKGVDFIVCNTDQQSLDVSPVPLKIGLGASLTRGRGAGSLPEVGKNAAIETIEEIKELLSNNTEMLFITAGLGGGTGTGAAPVIAKAAKEMGILTVAIVTIPFSFEGKKRKAQAEEGLEALKQNVDTLLVISNDKLREIYGNLKVTEAFGHADDILTTAAKGIADIITTTLQINTDINDVKTVMKDSGVAIMGSSRASGENRALLAVEQAMASPLLNDSNIKGARYVLVNIMCGEDEITMDELGDITDYIQDAAGMSAEIIKGYGVDLALGGDVSVTIIATGFNSKADVGIKIEKSQQRIVHTLGVESTKTQKNATPSTTQITQAPIIKTLFVDEDIDALTNEKEETVLDSEPFMYTREEETVSVKKEESISFEFEITNTAEQTEDPYIISYVNDLDVRSELTGDNNENQIVAKIQNEEQLKKAQDRVARLRDLSFKVKSQNGLSELENEPAYKRKGVNLEATPHSSESQVSRFTLSEGDDKKVEIKPNNSFLHDNVD
jgi:cell division protein FtsZ